MSEEQKVSIRRLAARLASIALLPSGRACGSIRAMNGSSLRVRIATWEEAPDETTVAERVNHFLAYLQRTAGAPPQPEASSGDSTTDARPALQLEDADASNAHVTMEELEAVVSARAPAPVSFTPTGRVLVIELGTPALRAGWAGERKPSVVLEAPLGSHLELRHLLCWSGPALRTAVISVGEQLKLEWPSQAVVLVVEPLQAHAYHEELLDLVLLDLGAPAVSRGCAAARTNLALDRS